MSKLEVDAIEPQSGTTITIGASGDTVNLVGTLKSNGSPLPGDISEVVAGTGLSGGGTTGAVTINIEAAQPTITSLGTITSFRSTGIDDNSNALAMTIDSSERVGLNTTSPGAKLEIQTSTDWGNIINSTNSGTQYLQQFEYNGSSIGKIRGDNSSIAIESGSNLILQTANAERMRLNSTGLGIGTSNPVAPLVVSNGGASGIEFQPEIATNTNRITNYNRSAGSYNKLRLDALEYQFRIQGNEQMRLNTNGNIGIGTTNSTAAKVFIEHAGDVDDNGLYVYSNIGQTVPLVKIIQDGAGSSAPAVYIRNDDADGIALHLEKGNSNVTPLAFANQLFIEDDDNTGLTIGSPTSGVGSIVFGDSGDADIGKFQYYHSDNSMRFTVNASERMRITSAGSVGIGTSIVLAKLHVDSGNSGVTPSSNADELFIEGSANSGITIASGTSSVGQIMFADSGDNDIGGISYNHNDNSMRFTAGAGERMSINGSGQIIVGGAAADGKFAIASNAGSLNRLISLKDTGNAGGGRDYIEFFNNSGGSAGSIEHSGTSTVAYRTSSDYRLKENVNYDFDATSRLKQLKPARFNFIADADITVDGFIAHEVSDIVPEAIGKEKDALQVWKDSEELPEGVAVGDNKLDADGNTIPDYQGIDQSKLVPLLVKTIQELEARITQLENA